MKSFDTTKFSWVINFIGANQDAVLVGRTFGIAMANSVTYDTNNTKTVFSMMGQKLNCMRYSGDVKVMTYSDADRVAAIK